MKDTSHLIQILLGKTLAPEDILVTIDVKSLYTNIPHTEGIQALNRTLEETNTHPMKKLLICRLANLVLTKNYFTFNKKLYRQIQGTAMGTRIAPSYANIFMKYVEIQLIETSPKKPTLRLRFTDDIYMIWGHGKQALEDFKHLSNNIHPTIKFAFNSETEIAFLDTIIYRGKDNQILTRLYHKPTDNKQYLHYNSAHPWKQKRSVPYGLLIRCKRIGSEVTYFNKESKAIIQLISRRYPTNLLQEALEKVKKMDRLQLLRQNNKTQSPKIRLITHYNPSNPNFNQILQDHTGLLLMTRKEAIKPEDIQITYSRKPNLKDILIKGTLEDSQQTRGTTPCQKTRCKTCDHIQLGNTKKKGQERYQIRGSFTCLSRNMIYLLTCSICGKRYIGETEQTLNGRCRGHESNMRSNNDNIVSTHYKQYNYTSEDYIVMAIDKETDYNKRLRLEETWMILPQRTKQSDVSQMVYTTQRIFYLNWNGTFLK